MNPDYLLSYIQASARLLDLNLSDAQCERVCAHLQRTAAMAELLQTIELPPHAEPAELYCPRPFPGIGTIAAS